MKTAIALVRVKIEIDEDEVPNLMDTRTFVHRYVEDGSSDVLNIVSVESVNCSCGGRLLGIDDSCHNCLPEREEWRQADRRG